jgi:hypothetical protein
MMAAPTLIEFAAVAMLLFAGFCPTAAIAVSAESGCLKLSTDAGRCVLVDKRSGVVWDLGIVAGAELADRGSSVVVRVAPTGKDPVKLLDGALGIAAEDAGCALVPVREGLLIPADSPVEFSRRFPTSGYEGCHMSMMGFIKRQSALLMTWEDAYITPELVKTKGGLKCAVHARRPPHGDTAAAFAVTLTPLGKGDWNTIAAAYRKLAAVKGLAVTMAQKIGRNQEAAKMLGASNAKLWTCLARRRDEGSTKDENVEVKWTFDEAAQVAEHLKHDLRIDRCLFIIGGWTEGGYDCRHPDVLPANPECGGNDALANAVRRIKALGYVACLHDNYQDMYRDAKSWSKDCIQKKADGSLMAGGRWLGGRAWLVCAPKTLELARRPQNLAAVQKLFAPQACFIDTTCAVDPQECFDPGHLLTRNDDIRWKQRLSDYTRQVFGLFGSECGREWAIPHSEFFEGLSGVGGRYFHNLQPAALGATVIPLFEMVYHDCEVVFGKYGYRPEAAAEYVAHHVLCARPLNHHSFGSHLYWKDPSGSAPEPKAQPGLGGAASFTRADNGWAEGMCLTDRFFKNTHEILGPLAAATAHRRLEKLEFLTPDRAVRRATFGDQGVVVTVNFGGADYVAKSGRGQEVALPPFGFLIESPEFVAFHAMSWAGRRYEKPVLFAIRLDDRKTRIFHGFGDARLSWLGQELEVRREAELTR